MVVCFHSLVSTCLFDEFQASFRRTRDETVMEVTSSKFSGTDASQSKTMKAMKAEIKIIRCLYSLEAHMVCSGNRNIIGIMQRDTESQGTLTHPHPSRVQ